MGTSGTENCEGYGFGLPFYKRENLGLPRITVKSSENSNRLFQRNCPFRGECWNSSNDVTCTRLCPCFK